MTPWMSKSSPATPLLAADADGPSKDKDDKGNDKEKWDEPKGQDDKDKGNDKGNDNDKDDKGNDSVLFYSGHTVYPKGTNAIHAQHLHMYKILVQIERLNKSDCAKYLYKSYKIEENTLEILGPTNIKPPPAWHPWWHPDRNVRKEALFAAFKAAGDYMKANDQGDNWTKETVNAACHAAWDYKMGWECGYDSGRNIDIDNP